MAIIELFNNFNSISERYHNNNISRLIYRND